jgi:hypothetical protein
MITIKHIQNASMNKFEQDQNIEYENHVNNQIFLGIDFHLSFQKYDPILNSNITDDEFYENSIKHHFDKTIKNINSYQIEPIYSKYLNDGVTLHKSNIENIWIITLCTFEIEMNHDKNNFKYNYINVLFETEEQAELEMNEYNFLKQISYL